jgi:glc operon protein GlcG
MNSRPRPSAVLLLLALLIPGALAAQQPTPAPRITHQQAQAAMDAAEADARANNWNLTIVISDAEGIPIALRRMDGASARSYDIAMRKVRTALGSGMHTVDYARALAAGQTDTIPEGTTFEGGLLLRVDGEIVGAMTASGATGAQDAQVVRAGMAAIGIQP